jgi:hypothetical protein
MAETFGNMGAGRGESCSNPGFTDRFTCPGCYTDHEARPGSNSPVFRCCECGAPLRLSIEQQPVAVATVCDEDEEEEEMT